MKGGVLDKKQAEGEGGIALSEQEFNLFQKLIHQDVGIYLSPVKKSLVSGRLMKRLHHYGFASFGEYFTFATQGEGKEMGEYERMIDLISTNETHFFREPHHFQFLNERVFPVWQAPPGTPFRLWSAASSSGEEPYSLAITLTEFFGSRNGAFEIQATDINRTVLEKARTAVYPLSQSSEVPREYLSRYFMKGVRRQAGTMRVTEEIRQKIRFRRLNLNEPFPQMPLFDVIFCRNVMIYFNNETKRRVVERLAGVLKKGGYLFIGHAESLNGVTDVVKPVQPTVYQK